MTRRKPFKTVPILPHFSEVYPISTATLPVYDIDPVPGQPGAIRSQDTALTTRVSSPGQDDALTAPAKHYLSANALYSLAPADDDLFSTLPLNDLRTRRRVCRLLEATVNLTREFSQAEVTRFVGRAYAHELRQLFIELPYFPARKLGEVKMYAVNKNVAAKLYKLMEDRYGWAIYTE